MRRFAAFGVAALALAVGAAGANAKPAAQPAEPRMVVWESFGRLT